MTRVPIPRSLDEEAERWPRRRRQRESGGSWDERKSSMNLRRYPTYVAVGSQRTELTGSACREKSCHGKEAKTTFCNDW